MTSSAKVSVATGATGKNAGRRESTRVDRDTREDLISALRNLGFSAKRARERIETAVEKLELEGEQVSEEKILTTALRSG